MFSLEKILAPVDFSERSVGAARYAEALSEQFASEVVLLHVMPPPHYEFSSLEVGGTPLTELFEARTSQVQVYLDSFLKEELPRFNPKRVLSDGDPARKIVEYAHDEKMNLIVMPTHGYGSFRRLILGSVTAKILHDADCPVLTGVHLENTPEPEKISFETVLAAVDPGQQAAKVLAWASNMAAACQARLVLIHALPPLDKPAGESPESGQRQRLKQEAIDEIGRLQDNTSSNVEIMVEYGDAPDTVCSAARQIQASLIVIGRSSDAGVLGRLRANAYSIIRQSPCPVVSV